MGEDSEFALRRSTHLRVAGWLTSDGFRGHTGLETTEPAWVPTRSDRFGIQLRSGGEVTSEGELWAQFNARYRRWRLRGSVPYVEGAERLTITRRDRVVHDVPVAPEPPSVELTEFEVHGRELRVAWAAQGEAPLVFRVAVEVGDGRRIPLALDVTEQSLVVDLSAVPSSTNAVVVLTASDGVRSGTVSSPIFALSASLAQCVIARPSEGQVLPALQPITLLGSAWQSDGAELPHSGIEWRIDGKVVSTGSNLVAVHWLPQGAHVIELHHSGAPVGVQRAVTVDAVPAFLADAIASGRLPEF